MKYIISHKPNQHAVMKFQFLIIDLNELNHIKWLERWPRCLCGLYSILGAVIVIIGLYLLLWGKEEDQQVHSKEEEQSRLAYDEQKELTIQVVTSTESKVSPGGP